MAVAVANVGRQYANAISHTDALRYIGEHGRAAAEMFPGLDKQAFSVVAIHAPLHWLERSVVGLLQQTGSAHVMYEAGTVFNGFDNMTDALVYMLEVGVDREEVFGT